MRCQCSFSSSPYEAEDTALQFSIFDGEIIEYNMYEDQLAYTKVERLFRDFR